MASSAASRFFSYHRLSKDVDTTSPLTPHQPAPFYDHKSPSTTTAAAAAHTARSLPFTPRWLRLRRSTTTSSSSSHRSGWWRPRRPRVRVAGLRRLLGRKARLLRSAVNKVIQRFKDGKAHFGDLFAGNYMFLQVNPTTPKPTSAYFHTQMRSIAMAAATTTTTSAAAGDVGRFQPKQPPNPTTAKYYIPYRVAA